jgi:hypothetical protein
MTSLVTKQHEADDFLLIAYMPPPLAPHQPLLSHNIPTHHNYHQSIRPQRASSSPVVPPPGKAPSRGGLLALARAHRHHTGLRAPRQGRHQVHAEGRGAQHFPAVRGGEHIRQKVVEVTCTGHIHRGRWKGWN